MTLVVTDTLSDTAPETAHGRSAGWRAVVAVLTVRMRAYARASLRAATALWQRAYAVAVGDDKTIWSSTPASPAEMVRYARDGAWCSPGSRFWRALGRLYSVPVVVLVALAYAGILIVQRPGRFAAAAFFFVLLKLIF